MLTLLTALLAIAPIASPGAQHLRRPAVTCEVSEVRSPQAPWRHHRFRATRIVELELEARLDWRSKRERRLELRVYTPDGFLYQVLELSLVEPRAWRRRVFKARLPVAGTSIMTSGLYGRWSVVPHLDGAREPCGKGRSFVIQP